MDRRDLLKVFGLAPAAFTPTSLKNEVVGSMVDPVTREVQTDKYGLRHIARWALFDTLVLNPGDLIPHRLEWFNGFQMDPALRPREHGYGQTNMYGNRSLPAPCAFLIERIMFTNSMMTGDRDLEALRALYFSLTLGCKTAYANFPLASILSLAAPAAPGTDGYVMRRIRKWADIPTWETMQHSGDTLQQPWCFDLNKAPVHITEGLYFYASMERDRDDAVAQTPIRFQTVLDGYMAFPVQ